MLVGVLPYIAVIFIVALLLARAFRREIGGDAAALISGLGATEEPDVMFIFSVVFCSLPDFHTALDEWECWNAGFRLVRPSAILLSVGVPLHLQLS